MRRLLLLVTVAGLRLTQTSVSAADSGFAVRQSPGRLEIACDGGQVATFVFRDSKILRPYFADLHAPGGVKVTRNHPPISGVDATDHDTMHPGLWLAFGDINGQDFWRNKGRIEHVRFTEAPKADNDRLTFATESRLQSTNGQTMGTQTSRLDLAARSHGFLLIWQADFRPAGEELVFGDQEEMGMGVRVATRITEKNGGSIVASTGAKTARATWGKPFEWCDYSGELDGRRVGVTLMPDPTNFRASWFHNRDYGLMVANPFGRKAMNQGETSRVVVRKGERLSLRFGVYLHSAPAETEIDLATTWRDFVACNGATAPD